MAKLCEEERAILLDEPSDVVKNLGFLTALRQASEAEAPLNRAASLSKSRKKRNELDGSSTESPGPTGPSVSDKASRIKGAVPRSGSVSSTQTRDNREVRDNVAIKIEEGTESTKGTIAERSGHLVIGAEVVFKHNKNKQGVEGEGIQCIIKNIVGEGHKKRYVSLAFHFSPLNILFDRRKKNKKGMMSRTPNRTRMANKAQSTKQQQPL